MSESRLDTFFATVARESRARLPAGGASPDVDPATGIRTRTTAFPHWLVVEHGADVAVVDLDEPPLAPHPTLTPLVDDGAAAAAHVTYLPRDGDRVIAYAMVADPRDSDVRWSAVERRRTPPGLGQWVPAL